MKTQEIKKVLIIEHNKRRSIWYKKAFKHCGYMPVVCHNEKSGFRKIVEQKPAIILLDIEIPKMNGIDFLAKITNHIPNHPPIIICSACNQDGIEEQCLQLGASRFLSKTLNSPNDVALKSINILER